MQPTPGGVRAQAAFLLWRAGHSSLAGVFGALIIIDFALQYDRVSRLLGV